MNKFVTPKVYLIGQTEPDVDAIVQYLKDTDQEAFIHDIATATTTGLSGMEILCSFYAKLCYAALTPDKNDNISRVRAIQDNILGTVKSRHGSVFEHASFNFLITNCSRVFTHELVRHRVGTAFSQTSGRYVRGTNLKLVHDPILDDVMEELDSITQDIENQYRALVDALDLDNIDSFTKKKKLTSALRRILPNGQSNEIGFTCNLRSLRHIITMRTSRHAEWEIRHVFNQVVELLKPKLPAYFADMIQTEYDGINETAFTYGAI